MSNQTETIVRANRALMDGRFNEEQRMATLESIAEMQRPLYESIADLKADLHNSIKELRTDLHNSIKELRTEMHVSVDTLKMGQRRLELMVAGMFVPLLFIGYRVFSG